MDSSPYTHVAFADESNWNQGTFRSICLVSAAVDDARLLHQKLKGILSPLCKKNGNQEFKWAKRNREMGMALAGFFFSHWDRMRVDVLIWDMNDSRHRGVLNCDFKADFARMYYHLLQNVLKRRWPDGARWLICPDRQKEVDWLTLEECLGWKSWAVEEHLFTTLGEMPSMREFYNIYDFREVCSKEYPLVQLADLFAGLGTYSYSAFEKYSLWKAEHEQTPSLFDPASVGERKPEFNRTERVRFSLLQCVRQEAGRRKLQVSLDSSRGLCSKNPSNPRNTLNFWLYESQRPEDRAPEKPARESGE